MGRERAGEGGHQRDGHPGAAGVARDGVTPLGGTHHHQVGGRGGGGRGGHQRDGHPGAAGVARDGVTPPGGAHHYQVGGREGAGEERGEERAGGGGWRGQAPT